MPSYNKISLSENEKERYGRRLTHFLEDFAYKNNLTHAEIAEILGITQNKYSQLKSGAERGRFFNSLDYLKGLAALDGLDLLDFLLYLEGEKEPKSKQNYSWQDKLYKALEPISISHRRNFADALTKASEDKNRVELMCRLATAMADKNINALEAMVVAMEKI